MVNDRDPTITTVLSNRRQVTLPELYTHAKSGARAVGLQIVYCRGCKPVKRAREAGPRDRAVQPLSGLTQFRIMGGVIQTYAQFHLVIGC